MGKLKYTFKSDILFKMVFVKYPHLLKELVAVILGITVESITAFDILNAEITPESIGDKFCRLDINMKVNGQRVDIEMQVANEGNYPERVMYYWAREYSSALLSGEDYSLLPRTIVISIVNFKLFDCMEFHSFFQPLETKRHELLSDKMGLHFFELPKVPIDISGKDELLLWLSLFKAETEEELEKLNKMGVSVMSEAIKAYRTVTASPEYREMERLREKAGHDEAQALHAAELRGEIRGEIRGESNGISKGKAQVAHNLIKMGMSVEQVVQATGLAQGEVETIYNSIYLS